MSSQPASVPVLFLSPHGLPLLVGAARGRRGGHAPPNHGRPQHGAHVVVALVIEVDIGFALLAAVVFVSLSATTIQGYRVNTGKPGRLIA